MELQQLEVDKLRKVETDILKEVIRVCDIIGVNYYVMYGTLLGAVRHKGFIPWDDDIDIGFLRADYETFIREAPKYLPEYYFVQTNESDPDCPYNFGKVRDSRTTFIESSIKDFKVNHGAFIDLFPIDFYPEERLEKIIFELKKKIYLTRIRCDYTLPEELAKNIKGGYRNVARKAIKILFRSRKKAVKKLDSLYKSCRSSSMVISHNGAWGNEREILPYEWYGEGIKIVFEDIKVNAPCEYDKWLKHMYGDYMQLPPEEKRKAHHYNEIIDLDHPYSYYTDPDSK